MGKWLNLVKYSKNVIIKSSSLHHIKQSDTVTQKKIKKRKKKKCKSESDKTTMYKPNLISKYTCITIN